MAKNYSMNFSYNFHRILMKSSCIFLSNNRVMEWTSTVCCWWDFLVKKPAITSWKECNNHKLLRKTIDRLSHLFHWTGGFPFYSARRFDRHMVSLPSGRKLFDNFKEDTMKLWPRLRTRRNMSTLTQIRCNDPRRVSTIWHLQENLFI